MPGLTFAIRQVTNAPRISVLLSTYASARFVQRKLAELRAQTIFRDAEFIFIETASPERERELIAPFCREHANVRLVTTEERHTLYGAWNLGWAQARAPLVCYSNMDDAMHPRLLQCIVNSFAQKRWDLASVLIAEQRADDSQIDDWSPTRLRRLKLNTRPGPFTAWRNELSETLGMFDAEFIGAGDLDFWSRAAHQNLRLSLVPKVLYLYTKSPGQLSKSANERRALDEERLAKKPYRIGWPRRSRWQVKLLRGLARFSPDTVCVPP